MTRYILSIALLIPASGAVFAQDGRVAASAGATNETTAAAPAINLQSGSRVAAELQSALDVRRAKVGDRVVLKTTEAIKTGGRTIVNKGARLTGRITQVSRNAGSRGESSLSLVFDRLESGSLDTPINATITSIAQASTRARVNDDDLRVDGRTRSSTTASSSSRSSSGNGGLLGGVGGAVGGVLNTTTRTAGDVVGGTTDAVGGAVGGVTKSVGGIRISQSTDASIEGGSTLSLTGDNLRLEKGTSFNLRLTQAAGVGPDN